MSKKLDVRPDLDDVERISKGLRASNRGVGSRGVPHRLNEAERKEWDLAKKRKYLELRGTGYRKERGDSPLANIYRQYCDATAIPFVSVCKMLGQDVNDKVIIDFSPLRIKDVSNLVKICLKTAEEDSSFVKAEDLTHLFEYVEATSLENEVIWRLPSFVVEVTFSERAASKSYALKISELLISSVSVV